MWISFTNWLTPSSLFIIVNLFIAIIALTSKIGAPKTRPNPQLLRPPSLLLRLKSFSSSLYTPESDPPNPNPPHLTPSPSRSDPPENPPEKTTHETHDHVVSRSKSESGSFAPATSLQRRLRKSLSEKLAWASLTVTARAEEDEGERIERRRPATCRTETALEDGGEVDAKADDFINRFKQQLKLQRLESLLRYRDQIMNRT